MILTYVLGVLGPGILLAAFILDLFNLLDSRGRGIYALMNVVGAGITCYTSYRTDFSPFVILFAVWFLAAVIGLFRSGRRNA